jgi:hypothetical protein
VILNLSIVLVYEILAARSNFKQDTVSFIFHAINIVMPFVYRIQTSTATVFTELTGQVHVHPTSEFKTRAQRTRRDSLESLGHGFYDLHRFFFRTRRRVHGRCCLRAVEEGSVWGKLCTPRKPFPCCALISSLAGNHFLSRRFAPTITVSTELPFRSKQLD